MSRAMSLDGNANGAGSGAWVGQAIAGAFSGEPLVSLMKPIPDPLRAFREALVRMITSGVDGGGLEIAVNERGAPWGRHYDDLDDTPRFVWPQASDLPDLRALLDGGAVALRWCHVWEAIRFQLYDRKWPGAFDREWPGAEEARFKASNRHERMLLRLPRSLSEPDAALLLVASGTVEGKVPLGLAIALSDSSRTIDPFRLDEAAREYSIATATDGPPPGWWGVRCDSTDESLGIARWWGDSRIERTLAPLFTPREGRRHEAGADCWAYLLKEPAALLAREPRCGDRKNLAAAAAGYGYDLQWIDDHATLPDEVEGLLARARTGEAIPGTLAGAMAKGILAEYAPLTANLPALREGDAELDWSPAECLDRAMPEFAELGSSQIREESFGAVHKLLTLLVQMKRGRRPDGTVWPGGVKYSWRFKFRTTDHTWIRGDIYRTTPRPKPGVKASALTLPAKCGSGISDRYSDSAYSDWFGTPTLRCRVKEQQA